MTAVRLTGLYTWQNKESAGSDHKIPGLVSDQEKVTCSQCMPHCWKRHLNTKFFKVTSASGHHIAAFQFEIACVISVEVFELLLFFHCFYSSIIWSQVVTRLEIATILPELHYFLLAFISAVGASCSKECGKLTWRPVSCWSKAFNWMKPVAVVLRKRTTKWMRWRWLLMALLILRKEKKVTFRRAQSGAVFRTPSTVSWNRYLKYSTAGFEVILLVFILRGGVKSGWWVSRAG